MSYAAVNSFDVGILHWLNALVGRSPFFDKTVQYLAQSELRGAVFFCLFWWVWFGTKDLALRARAREYLLRTLGAGILAIVTARVLALTLPFRIRPRWEPTLTFIVPDPGPGKLMDWSSFPSDHAVMFSALAVGLCFISWRLGLLAFLYTVLIICLPRVYLGFHYPTDIIAGLVLGAFISYCVNAGAVGRSFVGQALRWEGTSPGLFYGLSFLVMFEFSTMFDSLTDVAAHAVHFGAYLIGLR